MIYSGSSGRSKDLWLGSNTVATYFVLVVPLPFFSPGKKQIGPVSEKLVYSRCDSIVVQERGMWGHQEMLQSLLAYLNKLSEENPPLSVEDAFFGDKAVEQDSLKVI